MNTNVVNNLSKLRLTLFILPSLLLITIVLFLYSHDSLSAAKYALIQKDYFIFINHHLGLYPTFEYNLTQIGNALIFLSLLTIFIVYAPKVWEALISASLVSLIFSSSLKNIFGVPRPSQIFDNSSFIIIGKKISGFASLPSGHSITIFTTLTVLLFAFMPKKLNYKIVWSFCIVAIGLVIAFSRVAVGAHHPLDVIIGSIIGYISGLTGIFICQKYPIFNWVNNKKFYPIFILLIVVCCILLINKIFNENLIIFYLALLSLTVSLYKITYVYLKK